MYKNILQTLLMAIALLSIHMVGAGADIVYGAAHSPTDSQVEHAVYTQAGEGPVLTKAAQNVPTIPPLHAAARAGDEPKARKLLAAGHDANGLDEQGFTPLFWTARSKDLSVARTLVAHGAQVNFASPTGSTPLLGALVEENKELALWLLEQGASPKGKKNVTTPLHVACQMGMEDVVASLLERGADVNALNEFGFSPLSAYVLAAVRQPIGPISPSLIFRLLEAGANYDPLPVMKGSLTESLMDICLKMADSSTFEPELVALIARTKNAKLRAYAQEMLARFQRLPSSVIVENSRKLQRAKEKAALTSVQSSLLGTLPRDLLYNMWKSEPIAVPFYNNEKVVVTYAFDPQADPAFLADADKAMAALLKLNDAFRLTLSDRLGKYAQKALGRTTITGYEAKHEDEWLGLRDMRVNEAWLKAFEAGKKPMTDVWRTLGNLSEIFVRRNKIDGLIYVDVCWHCLWGFERSVQLKFREGTSLVNIDVPGGQSTE